MDFWQDIAVRYRDLFLILHLFAMVLGLGGATYTDILLFTFMRDLRIDKKEKEVVNTMSKAVFTGVFLALFSGVMLFLVDPDAMLEKSKFVAKVIIFSVIFLNGFLLHKILLPKLIKFSFDKEHYIVSTVVHLRNLGFVMGAVSGVSWYSVFILGALSDVKLSVFSILGIYFVLLTIAILFALLVESRLKDKHNEMSFVKKLWCKVKAFFDRIF